MNLGVTGVLMIFLVALLLFGPSKLPQLGRAIGTTIREFRKGSKELLTEEQGGSGHPSNEERRTIKDDK